MKMKLTQIIVAIMKHHEWIGKAEWLHSDRWSAAYDWVYDGKFADVDIPDDIINCLVEEWEKSMGLKVGI